MPENDDCPSPLWCDQELHVCSETPTSNTGPVTLDAIEVIFPQVYPAEVGVPLYFHFRNALDHPVRLYHLDYRYRPESDRLPLHGAEPIDLAAGVETTLEYILRVAPDAPVGAFEINARAVLYDVAAGSTLNAGLADEPGRFEVMAGPIPDTDRDGLTDQIELRLGTAIDDPDPDGDAIDDIDETRGGDAAVDSDGDHLIDAWEDDSDGGGEPDLLEWWRNSDRTDPADDRTFTDVVVTSTADVLHDSATTDHPISLRDALVLANQSAPPTRIRFDVAGPITISGALMHGYDALLPDVSGTAIFIEGGGAVIEHDPTCR